MPRPLVYSNGRMHVGVDSRGTIRDLFYPQIGLPNHLNGHWIRMGVWANGAFSWCDDEDWSVDQGYSGGTMVGRQDVTREGVSLQMTEWCDPVDDVFYRRIEVVEAPNDVKLFFTHDLRIAESDIGDCAFYQPFRNCLVHYKGPYYFGFGIVGRELDGYACGVKGFGGMEGTWRDAEDGELSMKPIEQGSVDSTFFVTARKGEVLDYFVACAPDLMPLMNSVDALQPQPSLEGEVGQSSKKLRMIQGWTAQPDDLDAFAWQSALILLTQIDSQGAIIASTDSEIMQTARANYCYAWPRDGALVATTLDQLGWRNESRRYFSWLLDIKRTVHPLLLQKYRPDGLLGASWHPWISVDGAEIPFQEDESASTVSSLDFHLLERLHYDDEEQFRAKALSFMDSCASYMAWYVDQNGFPRPSYDLWEERRGVHAYTVACVYRAVCAAHRRGTGAWDPPESAVKMQTAFREHFVHDGVLVRTLQPHEGSYASDRTVDASLLPTLLSGILALDDPVVTATAELVERTLWIDGVGGLARYENDYYFRQGDGYAGNPWIITTLWLARYKIAMEDLERGEELLRWAMSKAAPTCVLPEQLHPWTGEHLSVSPLTWSHAEWLSTWLYLRQQREELS